MEKRNKKKELSLTINQFFKIVYVDFGIAKVNTKLKNWYKLSWNEFKNELESQNVSMNDNLSSDWEEFFGKHKQKVLSLMN